MLVHRVHEFIRNLVLLRDRLHPSDLLFLRQLQSLYEGRDGAEQLTLKEFELFERIFSRRWDYIADTIDDYSFGIASVREISNEWIAFAKDLALELGKPYLMILIPPMKLGKRADLSLITANFESGYFFLSDHNKPCSTLELFRVPDSNLLSLLELYRLRAKSNSEQQFTGSDGSSHRSFWEYLQETKFPMYQIHGRIPLDILAKLKLVCQAYFVRTGENLGLFYQQLVGLSNALSAHPLDNVYYIYGLTIQVQGVDCYLIDILLDCISLREDLGERLQALARWQQDGLQQALFAAILNGDLADIKSIIQLGGKIDLLNLDGQVIPPEVAKFFAECEAKELFLAVTRGNIARVQQLLEAGLSPFLVNDQQQTLLHVVNNVELANLLIGLGLKLNQKDVSGNLPLHLAVGRNNLELVRWFLQEKEVAQVHCINELGNTPLHIAAHQDFEFLSYQHSFSLHSSTKIARNNNLAIMQLLVDAGAGINARNYFDFTPLHLAVSCCHNCFGKRALLNPDYAHVKNKVRFLCQHGANPRLETGDKRWRLLAANYQNYYFNIYEKSTPLEILYLHEAEGSDVIRMRKLKTEIAAILIQAGADSRVVDSQELSLLHKCAKQGDLQGLDYFIKLGLDVNQPASDAQTPLHTVLFWQGSKANWLSSGQACVASLLASGANPDIEIGYKMEVNSGSSLNDTELKFLFEKPNLFSRILILGANKATLEDRRDVFKKKWQGLGCRPMSISISLLPEEFAQLSPFVELCDEAISYLSDCRAKRFLQVEFGVSYQHR